MSIQTVLCGVVPKFLHQDQLAMERTIIGYHVAEMWLKFHPQNHNHF
jgi:hypothetical protein